MSTTTTSADALDQHVRVGRARTQRERIFECLMCSAVPLTRRQIGELTGIRINAVCGRVAELLEDKRIRVLDRPIKDEGTGMLAQAFEPVVPQPMQRKLWPS